jgi:hypothetical protein
MHGLKIGEMVFQAIIARSTSSDMTAVVFGSPSWIKYKY